ncbi:MAG: hypothetical protein AB1442_16870 [Nitrospirota bacterium]
MRKVFCLLFVVFLGCHNYKVRSALNEANIRGAKVLVMTYQHVYKFIGTEDGTYVLCKDLLEKHEKEIREGTYSEGMLRRDCADTVRIWEIRFDKILTAVALNLEVAEDLLATWKSADEEKYIAVIGNLVMAFKNLLDFLKVSGVNLPDQLESYMADLTLLENTIICKHDKLACKE